MRRSRWPEEQNYVNSECEHLFFFNTATPHMARVPPVLISPPQYSALTSQMETRRTTRPTMQRFDLSVSVYCVREFVLSLQHTVYTQSPRLERIPFYI